MADPIIGGLASLGSGLLGSILGGQSIDESRRFQEEQLKRWLELNVPDPKDQELILERYRVEGTLTPELEQAIAQTDSNLKGISVDPRLRQAEYDALASLQDISNSGGMTLTDQANLEKNLGQARTQNKGAQERIIQNMQERGMGGSGQELAARMIAGQQSGELANQAGLQAAASASDRGLQALMQAGNLGADLEKMQWGQGKDVASAQDIIDRFNTQNLRDVQSRNVGAKNEAQKYNLGLAQDVSNANVDLANKQQQYNKELLQKEFQNKMGVVSGAQNPTNQLSDSYDEESERRRKQWAGIGGAANSYMGVK